MELFAQMHKIQDFTDTKGTQHREMEGNHGRIETRTTTVFHDVAWLQKRHHWPGLKSLVMVETVREIGERIERETRYYVRSLRIPAQQMGAAQSPGRGEQPALGAGQGVSRRRVPGTHRPRARQLHHHQTHGTESATAHQGQALDTRGAQGRCMGR